MLVLLPTCKNAEANTSTPLEFGFTYDKASLEEIVHRTVSAFSMWDEQAINDLLHPDFGVIVINNPGIMHRIFMYDRFSFSETIPFYFYGEIDIENIVKDTSHSEFVTQQEFQYGLGEPNFMCGEDEWDMPAGVYVDYTKKLVDLAKWENVMDSGLDYFWEEGFDWSAIEWTDDVDWTHSTEQMKRLADTDNATQRVFILYEDGGYDKYHFIFIGGKWYLLVIDTTDYCSA